MEIAEAVTRQVTRETRARVFVQQASTFGGRRGGMPVQYVLQAPNIEKLREVLPVFMEEVDKSPVLRMSDVNLKLPNRNCELSLTGIKPVSWV